MANSPGLTDAKLAEMAKVSRPYVTRIRRGERAPSLAVAAKLAEVTNLPMTAFLKNGAAG